jgi:diamine N-acetyltransferase
MGRQSSNRALPAPDGKWYPRSMAQVTLHRISDGNRAECLALRVAESQAGWVAPNSESLEQAAASPDLHPLAIYDARARGFEVPEVPMVGFVLYQLRAGVGFIRRLMIDQRFQGQGYGRAAMVEVIRRLKLHPEAEMICTCHRRENLAAARLYRSLGFVDWEISWAQGHPTEVFLRYP